MTEENEQPKDIWDKIEIVSKVIGVVAVPILAGFLLYSWNSAASLRQTSAIMTEIAVNVLSERPSPDGEDKVLRGWATKVLQNPDNPPLLSDEEARILQDNPFAYVDAWSRVHPSNPIWSMSEFFSLYPSGADLGWGCIYRANGERFCGAELGAIAGFSEECVMDVSELPNAVVQCGTKGEPLPPSETNR